MHDSKEISTLMHGEMRKAARAIAAEAAAFKEAVHRRRTKIEHEVTSLIAWANTMIVGLRSAAWCSEWCWPG